MDRLTDAFHDQAPLPPDTTGWADVARRRRTIRNSAMAAALFATVLLIPTGLLLSGSDSAIPAAPSSPATAQTPSPSHSEAGGEPPGPDASTATDPANESNPCTALPGGKGVAFNWEPVERLPDGANRVWLCPSPAAPELSLLLPDRPLDHPDKVSSAVELFNSLGEFEGEWPSPGCDRAEVGPYVALYGYPDGRLIPVRGALDSCDPVITGQGDNVRLHSDWVNSKNRPEGETEYYFYGLRGLWPAEQLSSPEGCPAATVNPGKEFPLADAVEGWLCPLDLKAQPFEKLTPQQLESLLASDNGYIGDGGPEPIIRIVLRNREGQVADAWFDGEAFQWAGPLPDENSGPTIFPSKKLAEQLSEAAKRIR
ncbi:hypothetical protein [Tessaracoccus sp. OH4464_COT-324]|uniref:hypothetical protein n=1 Tax=Tessaracoccus sp. OH4464_COT-324 TaxID=2491059 RepID=UPI000F63F4CD|nr:hypothetical protein [Tessaracoccus sp. OH4464_COT-324]RRD46768.1 hypothetical protein EII42_05965 [Tessaracoccus sp. OH4464_COT-324]